jgi:hypothetical protein
VSCLAERPYRIYSLFETKEYNPNGYYICKFTFNGIYQEVIVDDLFPVINSQMTIYVKPVRSKYIWVMVLEKCWAKLLKNYTNTNCKVAYIKTAIHLKLFLPSLERPPSSISSEPTRPWRIRRV